MTKTECKFWEKVPVVIKTSEEGTSYCPQCEVYAKEIDLLKRRIVFEGKHHMEYVQKLREENAELKGDYEADHEISVRNLELREQTAKRNDYLEAVVRAAEECGHLPRKWGSESCCAMCEALAALRESEKTK